MVSASVDKTQDDRLASENVTCDYVDLVKKRFRKKLRTEGVQ